MRIMVQQRLGVYLSRMEIVYNSKIRMKTRRMLKAQEESVEHKNQDKRQKREVSSGSSSSSSDDKYVEKGKSKDTNKNKNKRKISPVKSKPKSKALDKKVKRNSSPKKQARKPSYTKDEIKDDSPPKHRQGPIPSPRKSDIDKRIAQDAKESAKKKSGSQAKKQPSPAKYKPASPNSKRKKVKTIIMTGSVPVDQKFPFNNVHVLQHNGKVYSATLNQTKMRTNNNKYYMIQVLEQNDGKHCFFWTRWGRVGANGQTSLIGPTTQQYCISEYNRKFHDKYYKGEYRHLEMKYNDDDNDEKKSNDTKGEETKPVEKERVKDFVQSKLHDNVKKLMKLIYDTKMMNRQMIQIGYDANKMPLGKLSKDTILRGYTALKKLIQQLQQPHPNSQRIQDLNSTFYSYIPHDFGSKKMRLFMLDSKQAVIKKLQMLEALENIAVATKILKGNDDEANVIDQNYVKLEREIESVDTSSREYEIIEEYITNTHAKTHSNYSLSLENVFKLDRKNENQRFTQHITNKMLLWHGSRLTNYVGILQQGLRIAPPEAPVTGYMFGKGVYFADMVSKSANYCFTDKSNSTGLLLLCEVALGDTNDKTQSDYYANILPPGKHSTKGCGRSYPPENSYVMLDGMKVPLGCPVEQNTRNSSLLYNEYIVYDVAQVRLKYLLRVNFKYK